MYSKAAAAIPHHPERVNPRFVPLREQTDRTGLEIRKSLQCNALRISTAESIVTKGVALGELILIDATSCVRFYRDFATFSKLR